MFARRVMPNVLACTSIRDRVSSGGTMRWVPPRNAFGATLSGLKGSADDGTALGRVLTTSSLTGLCSCDRCLHRFFGLRLKRAIEKVDVKGNANARCRLHSGPW